MMSDLHARYAEEVAALSGAKAPALLRALATVPRERFLPPGPWLIESMEGGFYTSADADPRRVLHGVSIAIDIETMLVNGNPARFAGHMQQVDPRPGEAVFHVGAGFGYFSAVLAELVGPSGRVFAAEIEPELREQARINLAPYPHVEVLGDALAGPLPPVDILYSSAGAGTLPAAWLAALKPGGRMVVPITDQNHHGMLFLLHKIADDRPWSVKLLSFTRHYPCLGTREADNLAAVSSALTRPAGKVASLRFDGHEKDDSCWLHGDGWCLSTRPPVASLS
jgi:protein-L-isoaspartate(D-aspartate) O-methyltransferase